MKHDLLTKIKETRLYFDGGTGTCLSERGLPVGTPPALWSLSHPEKVTALHAAYLAAGCDILKTNTFGVTALAYPNAAEMIRAAVGCARSAVSEHGAGYIAFDVGPSGRLLAPLGDLAFEDAVRAYGDAARTAAECGVDLVLIETMGDLYEVKAAVLGVKEATELPIFVTCAFDRSGKLMTGADIPALVATLEGLGVSAVGMNCSFGPAEMLPLVEEFCRVSSLPIIANPNAGLPRADGGRAVYDLSPEDFARSVASLAERGASILGGCCGTTPEYLAQMIRATRSLPYAIPEKKTRTLLSSYTRAVELGADPILIGERLNPTGKKRLKEALREENYDYLIGEAIRQSEAGAAVLDVNVGLPELKESEVLPAVVRVLQASSDTPLCLDSSSPEALEAAMRIYNGKPLVNSVDGKEESMRAVLPLVKHYGGVLVVLTMDESGIPATAEGRLAIAERVAARAAEYGIEKHDLLIDPLTLTVSAEPGAARVTLEAVRLLSARGFHTSLGVSNVSFGLPKRELINAAFFSSALAAGLSAAIMNPDSLAMQDSYHAHRALAGHDAACADYIAYAEARVGSDGGILKPAPATAQAASDKPISLGAAIEQGRSDAAVRAARLDAGDPLALIENEIVPALDRVGRAFEEKRVYLPKLLMSADAASAAFAVIRERLPKKEAVTRRTVILATVKGDIHDIGKNIVRVLLESYGFEVVDLGKDVPPEAVADAVRASGARLVGLSALMTTTVPAMQETVGLLHSAFPGITVMVGGAVLTAEYAASIGADVYCADGMDAVRAAERTLPAEK